MAVGEIGNHYPQRSPPAPVDSDSRVNQGIDACRLRGGDGDEVSKQNYIIPKDMRSSLGSE